MEGVDPKGQLVKKKLTTPLFKKSTISWTRLSIRNKEYNKIELKIKKDVNNLPRLFFVKKRSDYLVDAHKIKQLFENYSEMSVSAEEVKASLRSYYLQTLFEIAVQDSGEDSGREIFNVICNFLKKGFTSVLSLVLYYLHSSNGLPKLMRLDNASSLFRFKRNAELVSVIETRQNSSQYRLSVHHQLYHLERLLQKTDVMIVVLIESGRGQESAVGVHPRLQLHRR